MVQHEGTGTGAAGESWYCVVKERVGDRLAVEEKRRGGGVGRVRGWERERERGGVE